LINQNGGTIMGKLEGKVAVVTGGNGDLGIATTELFVAEGAYDERSLMKILTRDGVRLAYSEAGKGTPSILLIHGWASDHTSLSAQMEFFSKTQRVVSVDLRGHGHSAAPYQDYTVTGFADDLAWQCHQLDLENPVLIGHGMGGAIALELAARLPRLPRALVLLDSILFASQSFVEDVRRISLALRGKEYLKAFELAAASLFLNTDDPAGKGRLLPLIKRTPQHVLMSTFENHLVHYDPTAAASVSSLPIAYIGATGSMVDLLTFWSLCPQLMVGQVLGSGRFSPLEISDQINPMIARFLKIYVPEHQLDLEDPGLFGITHTTSQ
jgi:pimeloyl-ACP methyl ester carboxylesterase